MSAGANRKHFLEPHKSESQLDYIRIITKRLSQRAVNLREQTTFLTLVSLAEKRASVLPSWETISVTSVFFNQL